MVFKLKKEIMFTKGWFRSQQGISLDPRHYEAIQQLREICRENTKIKPFILSDLLRPIIATLIENKCAEIEQIAGFNPLNGKKLPFSDLIEIKEVETKNETESKT